jgi:hypothetical protein
VDQAHVSDIVAGLFVAAAFLIAIRVAYRRGFRAALPVRSAEFDHLRSRLELDGSQWTISMGSSADQPDLMALPETLDWSQSGSRVAGRGEAADGTVWEMEGIVEDQQLVSLARSTGGETSRTSVWMLRGDATGDNLTGYWIACDPSGSLMTVRQIFLIRQSAVEERPEQPMVSSAPLSDQDR